MKAAALNLLTDWRKARVTEGISMRKVADGVQTWSKPIAGWKKINVDAAIFPNGYAV